MDTTKKRRPGRPTKADPERARALAAAGYTDAQIAAELGYSTPGKMNVAKRNNGYFRQAIEEGRAAGLRTIRDKHRAILEKAANLTIDTLNGDNEEHKQAILLRLLPKSADVVGGDALDESTIQVNINFVDKPGAP